MAPKKIGTAWLIRVPDELAAQIEQRRKATGLSRAETVRKMLAWAAAQPQSQPPQKRTSKRSGKQ